MGGLTQEAAPTSGKHSRGSAREGIIPLSQVVFGEKPEKAENEMQRGGYS